MPVPDEDRPVPAMAGKTVTAWEEGGCAVSFDTLVCEHFWGLPELVSVPALIEKSTRVLAESLA